MRVLGAAAGMQREQALAALSRPDDEQLFYSASVHFLKKRLQEKSHPIPKQTSTTQSCCNFFTDEKLPPIELQRESLQEINFSEHKSPLPMHQVLQFPKSSKDTFISRLRSRFRKMRFNGPRTETFGAENLSPRASPTNKYGLALPPLGDISEEPSLETVCTKRKCSLHLCDSQSEFMYENNEANKPEM